MMMAGIGASGSTLAGVDIVAAADIAVADIAGASAVAVRGDLDGGSRSSAAKARNDSRAAIRPQTMASFTLDSPLRVNPENRGVP